jgi:hypothetical protein
LYKIHAIALGDSTIALAVVFQSVMITPSSTSDELVVG